MPRPIKLLRFMWKYKYFRNKNPVCRRKSDETLWIPSNNGAASLAGLFTGEHFFYFRRCKQFCGGYIVDWNQVWQFTELDKFEIVDNRDAI